jgi:predicted ATP-dependent protease
VDHFHSAIQMVFMAETTNAEGKHVFGNDDMYEKMNQQDPDLGRMFQVRAEFVDRIESTAENHRAFARLIAGVVKRHGLRAVDAAGVAGVIAEAARMTGTPDKISVDMGRISDVVCEANHWAGKAGRQIISREDVVRAVEERAERTRGLTGQAPA